MTLHAIALPILIPLAAAIVLLLANRAMKECMKLLSATGPKLGKVVIGTVKGDLHDIGKNLVAAMLEGGGFEVIDLGVNVAPEKFI